MTRFVNSTTPRALRQPGDVAVEFVGPSYALSRKKADTQRLINMATTAIESGGGKTPVFLQSIPGLTQFSAYVPPVPPQDGDPYWDNVILMLHFLPAAPFHDDSKYHQTVNVINAPPLSTGPFPGSGAMVEKTEDASQPQLITSSGTNGLWSHSAAQEWTIDQWVYITSTANITLTQVWEWASQTHTDFFNQYGFYSDSHQLTFSIESIVDVGGRTPFSSGAWHFTRTIFTGETGLCQLWVDGVLAQSFVRPLADGGEAAYFVTGARNDSEDRPGIDLKVSEMRVTKGVARDGTEVPTKVFPNHGLTP